MEEDTLLVCRKTGSGRQRKAVTGLNSQHTRLLATRVVLKIGEYSQIFPNIPQFYLRNIRSRDAFRPLARKQKYLMDYNVEYYSQYLKLYKRFIDDIFAIWCGPKGTLLEFLNALNSKTDRIKLFYCISESSISFLDLFLYRDTSWNVLQFSSLLTNICTNHSSRFTLLAIRKPPLKGNL